MANDLEHQSTPTPQDKIFHLLGEAEVTFTNKSYQFSLFLTKTKLVIIYLKIWFKEIIRIMDKNLCEVCYLYNKISELSTAV